MHTCKAKKYRISIGDTITVAIKDEFIRKYKHAGWENVKYKVKGTSHEFLFIR